MQRACHLAVGLATRRLGRHTPRRSRRSLADADTWDTVLPSGVIVIPVRPVPCGGDPVVALARLCGSLEQSNCPRALLDMERPPTGSIEGRTLWLALDDEKKDRSGGDQSDGSDRGHYGACLGGSELVGRLRLGRAGHPMYPPVWSCSCARYIGCQQTPVTS